MIAHNRFEELNELHRIMMSGVMNIKTTISVNAIFIELHSKVALHLPHLSL